MTDIGGGSANEFARAAGCDGSKPDACTIRFGLFHLRAASQMLSCAGVRRRRKAPVTQSAGVQSTPALRQFVQDANGNATPPRTPYTTEPECSVHRTDGPCRTGVCAGFAAGSTRPTRQPVHAIRRRFTPVDTYVCLSRRRRSVSLPLGVAPSLTIRRPAVGLRVKRYNSGGQ